MLTYFIIIKIHTDNRNLQNFQAHGYIILIDSLSLIPQRGGKILSVYLDVLLAENFVVNYFLMTLTFQSIRYRPKQRYIALASFVGCLYVIIPLYKNLKILTLFPFKIAVPLLMVYITFGKQDIVFVIKATMIFILYSMMLAGFCVFLEFDSIGTLHNAAVIYNFSYKILLIALMIMYLILYRIVVYIKDCKQVVSLVYDVDICFGKYTKKVKAFLDTGNELREPATNLPVIIVESHVCSNINLDTFDKFYIPYKTVNGVYAKIIGIKPAYIKIKVGNVIKKREAIIGICNNKLSSCGNYEALLSRGII